MEFALCHVCSDFPTSSIIDFSANIWLNRLDLLLLSVITRSVCLSDGQWRSVERPKTERYNFQQAFVVNVLWERLSICPFSFRFSASLQSCIYELRRYLNAAQLCSLLRCFALLWHLSKFTLTTPQWIWVPRFVTQYYSDYLMWDKWANTTQESIRPRFSSFIYISEAITHIIPIYVI